MLVEWRGAGPLAIGDPRLKSNYKMARVIVCVPGINRLDDDIWPEVKKNPEVQRLIRENQLKVVREKDEDKSIADKKGVAKELAGLEAEEAVRLVKMTYNMGLLEEWADAETRNKVRRACEAQIASLQIKKKDE